MRNIDDVIKTLIGNSTEFATDELKGLIKSAKDDGEEYVRNQGISLEKYLHELAEKKMSKEEFQDLLEGIASIGKIRVAGLSAEGKVRAERVASGVKKLAIDALFKVLL